MEEAPYSNASEVGDEDLTQMPKSESYMNARPSLHSRWMSQDEFEQTEALDWIIDTEAMMISPPPYHYGGNILTSTITALDFSVSPSSNYFLGTVQGCDNRYQTPHRPVQLVFMPS